MGRLTWWIKLLLIGIAGFGPAYSVWGDLKVPPPGPGGRPVRPSPPAKKLYPRLANPVPLSPGPPILTPPVPLPGPLPGTRLVPGYWQGDRWIPGRLEIKEGQPTRRVPGYYTPEGLWVRGHWE